MNESSDFPTGANFYGAAIIEDDGREIPITEEMIVSACRELEVRLSASGHTGEAD